MGLVVVLGVTLTRWRQRFLPLWLSLPIAASLVLLAIIGVRERYRYDAYRLFAERQLLDFHGAPPSRPGLSGSGSTRRDPIELQRRRDSMA